MRKKSKSASKVEENMEELPLILGLPNCDMEANPWFSRLNLQILEVILSLG